MAGAIKRHSWWTPAVAVQIAVVAVVLVVQYQHVIDRLLYIWSTNGDWSHGYIIPFFSLYYLYMQSHRMPAGLPKGGWLPRLAGAGLIALAFAVYAVSTVIRPMEYPKTLSLILSVMGVVLMVAGWPIARWSWFAVAFLIFAMPVPTRLYVQMTMPLRYIAASVSAAVLQMSVPDMIAEGHGAIVEYIYRGQPGTLDIEQACSGIRLMMTMMALGVAMAFVSERPMWQRLVMILSCVPIAIFCNIIRVTTTGVFVILGYNELARGFWHTMLGLGMLFIAFGLYGGISYVLSHLVVETEAEPEVKTASAGGERS